MKMSPKLREAIIDQFWPTQAGLDATANDLADRALCTPLVDASSSLDVLTDLLLERGELREHDGLLRDLPGDLLPGVRAIDGSNVAEILRAHAFHWARSRHEADLEISLHDSDPMLSNERRPQTCCEAKFDGYRRVVVPRSAWSVDEVGNIRNRLAIEFPRCKSEGTWLIRFAAIGRYGTVIVPVELTTTLYLSAEMTATFSEGQLGISLSLS